MYYKKVDMSNKFSIVFRSWTIYDIISIICSLISLVCYKYTNRIILAILPIIMSFIARKLSNKKVNKLKNSISRD